MAVLVNRGVFTSSDVSTLMSRRFESGSYGSGSSVSRYFLSGSFVSGSFVSGTSKFRSSILSTSNVCPDDSFELVSNWIHQPFASLVAAVHECFYFDFEQRTLEEAYEMCLDKGGKKKKERLKKTS